ncbi:MAG: tRNA pseudouridine(38-40) synthase TruA [Bacilli bacterium]|nr:tRNA pseudouridine(38-40) synthase TruA [Bacilli bacterium]
MRYKITFSYDGTAFHGYQKQNEYRSVEECLENALYDINNHTFTSITSSGRTDKGVHAKGQVASFNLDVNITEYKLKCALNSLLPEDIHVINAEEVDDDFHPRYMAKEKKYVYYLNVGEYNPIERNYIYQYNRGLDIDKMKEGIKYFVGKHDFQSFVSNECEKDSYVREIFDARIEKEDDIIKFIFVGNGFMKYQVRNMVGTLVKVGKGKLEPIDIDLILRGEKDKNEVLTIKPEGLYLEEVKY